METQFSWRNVFKFAGAIVAYLIGAGFASGQEAMQYFTVFGLHKALGATAITVVLYVWFSASIMRDGYQLNLESCNKIFEYYCGRYLGCFYEIYAPIYLVIVFMVMISGAGAILTEYYGWNPQLGRIVMTVMALITVLLGLKKLVNIVSKLGPVIILFAISIGLVNIVMEFHGIFQASSVIKTIPVTRAAPTWYVSGVIFPSMGCILIAPFLARMGMMATSKKEAVAGGSLGGFAFALAVIVMCFGIMASIGDLYMKNIPALSIAQKIMPGIGIAFSIILFAAVYTTAVPMLWLSSNAIAPDEKSMKFRISMFAITLIAFIGGQFEFAKLVNVLYPISGYLGVLLFICIFMKQMKNWR